VLQRLAGGWQVTGTGIFQTGTPFTVFTDAPFNPVRDANGNVVGLLRSSGDFNADGVNYDFPNPPVGDIPSSFSRQDYVDGVFRNAVFPFPAPGQEGNLQRSSFRNPGFINIDLSLIKNNRIGERINAQFRFEVFNVLNRTNLAGVNGNLASSAFGRSTSTYDPRIIQLGVRVTF